MIEIKKGTALVVYDGQAGSCGKGKVAAAISELNGKKLDTVVATFGPNAGHTVVGLDGQEYVFRHLPTACVNKAPFVYIGASAIIDVEILLEEIGMADRSGFAVSSRLVIHPRACLVNRADIETDKAAVKAISSTGKGVGPAIARKILRSAGGLMARDEPYLAQWTRDERSPDWLARQLWDGARVMIETSQGFDLDINHGVSYPYCTSRQIGPAQAAADCGIPHQRVQSVCVVRPYPIRVGNAPGSTSGPYAADAPELMWSTVFQRAGLPADRVEAALAREVTTVTKRQRRVFEFSWDRFKTMLTMTRPNAVILNHADQLDANITSTMKWGDLPPRVAGFVGEMTACGANVIGVGTGPRTCDFIWRY